MHRTARLSLLVLVLALLPAQLFATDLDVTKTADQETAAVGDTIAFTIVVDNTSTFGGGPLPSSVDLFDRFTSGLMWIDISGDITPADCAAIAEGDGFDCTFDIEAGQVKTATVTFVVTEAGEQENAVSVAPTIGDPDPSDNEAAATVAVEDTSQAELQITKTADEDEVVVGDTVHYTIEVENLGPGTALDARLTDISDAGQLEYLSDDAGCTHEVSGIQNIVDCDLSDLAPGETKVVEIAFIVLQEGQLENRAGVAGDNTGLVFDTATITATPERAELRITKVPGEDSVAVGGTATFLIEVENLGPGTAVDVLLTDFSDASQLRFEGATADCFDTDRLGRTNMIECSLGDLAPGDKVVIETAFIVLKGGEIENQVGVEGSNADNVSEAARITGMPIPELQITKTADVIQGDLGDVITYTITVENIGSGVAEEVSVRDLFEDDVLGFIDGSAGCEQVEGAFGNTIDCDVGDLAPDETASVDIVFVVTEILATTVNNTGSARAENHDSVADGISLDIGHLEVRTLLHGAAFPGFEKSDKGRQGGRQGVDVYVDSLLLAENLAPGASASISGFPLGAISPYVHVVPTSAPLDDAVLAQQRDFFTGEITGTDFHLPDTYALILAGPEDSPTLLLQREARFEAENPMQMDVFFAHAAPDAPALSIRLFDSTESLVEEVEFGALTGYSALAPATHTLEVINMSGEVLDVFEVNLSGRQGEALALIIAPGEGGTSGDVALVVLDAEGNASDSPVVTATEAEELPERFALHGSYPNPFNPTTTLRFDLPEPASVRVAVYDLLGRRVLELPAQPMSAGFDRTIFLDGSSLASGIYLYSVSATLGPTTTARTRPLVVMK